MDIDKYFHALSDPLRIKIIELLEEKELCVCELCDRLQTSQPKLSFHLKTLREANLLKSRHQGKWIYYSLNMSEFTILVEYLSIYSTK
jgi:ArsR family transcriptional regulator